MTQALIKTLKRWRENSPPNLVLERTLMCASFALGLLHAWVGRDAMNPDGMSYLDVGNSFFHREWTVAINAWWSPLYPWLLGIVLGITKPSPKWEFPLVHLVNFGVFAGSLFAFRFFLHALLRFVRERASAALPEWVLILLAYPVFLWTALEVEKMYAVTPDLATEACLSLTAGMLLCLRPNAIGKFVLFGLILGVGYWVKAIFFPLGLVTLAVGYLWKRSTPNWGRGMALAGLVFVCSVAPLIFLLSQQKGRFTFGDSGRVNYAWAVSPRTFTRNWQGKEAGSGIPVHPTRQLLTYPPLFEFDGPIVGTYPPWTDPSYWNEGLQWHFKVKPQLEVLATTVPSEARLLIRDRPELVTGFIILALLGGRLWLAGLRELWPFIGLPILGMGFYLPVIENDRYLGGFVLVLFLALLAAVRLRPESQTIAVYVAVAVFVMMVLGIGDYAIRTVMHHPAIPGNSPDSALTDVIAAGELGRMGVEPGSKVAVIGDGTGAYWAHLAKLRIVAEIMGTNHGSREFWNASEEVRQQVYDAFRQAHAKLVVTVCPPCPQGAPPGWEPIRETLYCVRRLK